MQKHVTVLGVCYPSIKCACLDNGVKYGAVDTYRREHNLTIEEALELFIKVRMRAPRKTHAERHIWSLEEDSLLRSKYPLVGTNIPELLKVTGRESIRSRAKKLGVSTCERKPLLDIVIEGERLTQHELCMKLGVNDEVLRSLRNDLLLSPQQAADRLLSFFLQKPGGGFKRLSGSFNKSEDEYVHDSGKRWSLPIYCKEHGFSYPQVLQYKNRDGFTADEAIEYSRSVGGIKKYTQEEDNIICNNAHLAPSEIALLLQGRTVNSIVKRMSKLGLNAVGWGSVTCLSRVVEDIEVAAAGFTSTTGIQYVFVKCLVCHRVRIISLDEAKIFAHNEDMCRTNELPKFVKIPKHIRRHKEDSP